MGTNQNIDEAIGMKLISQGKERVKMLIEFFFYA
jgi:hypothetical protein